MFRSAPIVIYSAVERRIVTDTRKDTLLIQPGKIALVTFRNLRRVHGIRDSVNEDGRNTNVRKRCQLRFHSHIARIAGFIVHAIPMECMTPRRYSPLRSKGVTRQN